MKKKSGNKGLSAKNWLGLADEERKRRLRKMTMKESIHLTEEMMRMPLTREQIEKSNREDHPICLKLSLKRMRRAAQKRRRRADLKKGMNR